MPSLPSSADHQGQPSIRTIPEPDVSEWSELLVNEQEVATVGGIVCMAASNAIELTPLWPKNHHSPLHHKGWPADHKGKSGRGTAPQPPPLPSSCPPAVPSKSKNPPPAPPLPATSSREFRKQQETKRLANGHGQEQAAPGNEIKGPAPQPPVLHPNSPVTSQPLRTSPSVSRGLQVEEDDLIQFSNGQKEAAYAALMAAAQGGSMATPANSVAQLKRQLRSRLSLDEEVEPELNGLDGILDSEEADSETNETVSARDAGEQIDYLEGLEPCPCYAKCCLDSIISLFCVTVLG